MQLTYFFPPKVFEHILSYCEDPMILYKRIHKQVWQAIRTERHHYWCNFALRVRIGYVVVFNRDEQTIMRICYTPPKRIEV